MMPRGTNIRCIDWIGDGKDQGIKMESAISVRIGITTRLSAGGFGTMDPVEREHRRSYRFPSPAEIALLQATERDFKGGGDVSRNLDPKKSAGSQG